MYPFERYLRTLKKNVRNKAKVEGSICNAYLAEEASSFCSYYFEDHVMTKHNKVPRNHDGREGVIDENEDNLSIFKYPGRAFGMPIQRFLSDQEFKAAHSYVLLNCREVKPYIDLYLNQLKQRDPNITAVDVDASLENDFAIWFNQYAHGTLNTIENKIIRDLAKGPLRCVTTYPGYYVNGYKFHTTQHGSSKATANNGVCIRGANYSFDESDYYGVLDEIIEVDYPGLPRKKVVLFKCDWFDPSNIGTKILTDYKLVDVNHKCRFSRYEPFVLAIQATQVYYCTYPTDKRSKSDWWTVCKIKSRFVVELPESSTTNIQSMPLPFQEDDIDIHNHGHIDEDPRNLASSDGEVAEIEECDEDELQSEDELQTEESSEYSTEEYLSEDSEDDDD